MNFSDLFKQSTQLCEFSPDGKSLVSYLARLPRLVIILTFTLLFKANVVQFRLIIREVNSLEIKNIFTCLDTINYIEVRTHKKLFLIQLSLEF